MIPKYAQNELHHCRALYNKMELCPNHLDVKLYKDMESPSHLFNKNGVLQLPELFQHFIKAIGKAMSELRGERSQFRAENGVIIEMDSAVCKFPQCMEDDGLQKIHRFLLNSMVK